jgi:hypothetical protein
MTLFDTGLRLWHVSSVSPRRKRCTAVQVLIANYMATISHPEQATMVMAGFRGVDVASREYFSQRALTYTATENDG